MEWQRCPVCNMDGKIQVYPAHSPNLDTSAFPEVRTCPVCNGKLIINKYTGTPPVGYQNEKTEFINRNLGMGWEVKQ